MTGRAKILARGDVCSMLRAASQGRYPHRNRVMVLLSVRAGLRAGEIAKLTWPMVLDPNRRVSDYIELANQAAKLGRGRRVPIHPELKRALLALRRTRNDKLDAVLRSERRRSLTAKSVVNWFKHLFRKLGMKGCSSHSGRRTFVTRAARLANTVGGSLRDVQVLVGHRSIRTTEAYIEGSSDAQRRLVRAL